ncbi:hypothetical protein CBL_04082 [Carabus blaptoides fortunei]
MVDNTKSSELTNSRCSNIAGQPSLQDVVIVVVTHTVIADNGSTVKGQEDGQPALLKSFLSAGDVIYISSFRFLSLLNGHEEGQPRARGLESVAEKKAAMKLPRQPSVPPLELPAPDVVVVHTLIGPFSVVKGFSLRTRRERRQCNAKAKGQCDYVTPLQDRHEDNLLTLVDLYAVEDVAAAMLGKYTGSKRRAVTSTIDEHRSLATPCLLAMMLRNK